MCGRYRRTTSEEELARRYHVQIPPQRDLPISWNIALTQDVLAIRFNPESKRRTIDALRWGLIPNWAKDPNIAYKTINARVVLFPQIPFYERKKVVGGKIPFSIGMKDDAPFVFGGLWEGWKDPANGEWLRTCTIITGEPNELVREIHTWMPVILPEQHQDAWLSGAAGKEILVLFPADRMNAWPISARVNTPKNDDAEIIVPIELESVARSENLPRLL